MKVFISWSGNRSRAVAELLDEWIQCVLQAIRPWMSSKDIDRGSLWFSEITDQLKDTKIGIVCLTRNNLNKPWILFEAGALAKGLSSSRICTFLIDIETTDVSNPLAQFNHTMPDRDGLYELVRTLNSTLGDSSLREKVLEQVFDTYWPQFEEGFKKALAETESGDSIPVRTDENIMVEVLRTVRSLDRRVRSIENIAPDIDNPRSVRRNYIPEKKARYKIFKMIEDGLPVDVVEETMLGQAPQKFIKMMINECLFGTERELNCVVDES